MPTYQKPSDALSAAVSDELGRMLKAGHEGPVHADACIVRAVGKVLDAMQQRFDDAIKRIKNPNDPFTPPDLF